MKELMVNFDKLQEEIHQLIDNREFDKICKRLEGYKNRHLRETMRPVEENLFKDLFNNSLSGTCITSRDGNIVECNQKFLELFEYKSLDEIKKYNANVLWAETSERQKFIDELSAKRIIKGKILKLKTRSNKTLYVTVNSFLAKATDDKLLITELVDITRQIEFEKELIESEKHLLRQSEDIALNKFISEKIESSEKKFRTLFENSRDAILLINEDGFFDCNQAALDLFKMTKTELLKSHPGELSAPEQPDGKDSFQQAEIYMKKAYKEKLPVFEWVHKRSDGTEFLAEVLLSPIKIENKLALQSVVRDISVRKKNELELKKREEKFRLLTEAIPAIISIQKDNRFLYVNQAMEKLTGYSKKELESMNSLDIVHPEFKEKVEKRSLACLKGKRVPKRYDIKIVSKNGRTRWIGIAHVVIEYDEGHALLSVANDITELKYAQQTIKSSERKFKSLFYDNFSVMMIINPSNGLIVDANQAACDYYGYRHDIITSMNINQINTLSSTEIENEMKNARENKRNYFLFKHKLANNSIRDVEVYSGKVVVEEKEFLYSIVHDVTERKQAEAALRRSEIELRKLNAQKDRFFSIIAHDLRSPISNFLQFAHLLELSYQTLSKEKVIQYIERIKSLAENTFKFLENLLIWSRSQLGKLEIQTEILDLRMITEEVLEQISERAGLKGITINNTVELGKLIHVDKQSIQTVLRNLLNNAIKFTSRNGKITISAKESRYNKKRYTEVSIKDTGVGISKGKLEKLFSMADNVSTPGTENEKGTGLGLILCKELTEKNEGRIRVESDFHKGSTFTLILPSEL